MKILKLVVLHVLLSVLTIANLVGAGRLSATLEFTGNAENDFTTLNSTIRLVRKGVVRVADSLLMGVETPDVGLPPGSAWSGRVSGWDIKNLYFQLDFDTGALHIGIDCFGVCGDADGDGNPDAASTVLVQAGGNDNPDFALTESFALGLDLGGPGTRLAGDGIMDFVIGYPAQLGDQSDRFPCGVRFDITCFGLYFFQAGATNQPGTRFIYTTSSYRSFAAGLLTTIGPNVVDHNNRPSAAQPDLEWSIRNFNGVRQAAGFDLVDLNGVIPWRMNVVGYAGSFQDDGIGEDFLPNNAAFVTVEFPCWAGPQCNFLKIDSLNSSGCFALDHGSATGDDRGGIAVSVATVFYTGDTATARFPLSLSSASRLNHQYDALVSDIATGQVYTLGSGDAPLQQPSDVAPTLVSTLLAINATTGDVIASPSATVTLSSPIAVVPGTGIFAGAAQIVLLVNGTAFAIALPSGVVTVFGNVTMPEYMACESWAFWGVAESFGRDQFVAFVSNSRTISRMSLRSGVVSTVATFSDLSDMCSFSVSPAAGRWYFHFEGSAQFTSSSGEWVGYCSATVSQRCDDGTQCAAGRTCVDGVCCSTACTGACEACNVSGKEGTCTPNCVLAIHAEIEFAMAADVQSKLTERGLHVVLFNGRAATPSLQQLQMVSSVFVWSNAAFANGVVLGNVLADFVDGGGHVVVAVFASISSFALSGRFNMSEMLPIPIDEIRRNGRRIMVKVRPDHPLLLGVDSFDGGSESFRPDTRAVARESVRVADWSSGEPLVAVFDDKFNGSVVSLGFFPVSSDAATSSLLWWQPSTDGAQLMTNAVTYRRARLQGKPCVRSAQCEFGLHCVDGVCCDSVCSSPCQSCNQAGLAGVCSATCTVQPGCQSTECAAAPVRCDGQIRGWIGNACYTYTGADSGVCAASSGTCLAATFNAGVCARYFSSAPAAECGSPECKRAGACVPGAAALTANSVAEVCYTLADSASADACPRTTDRCDNAGTCVQIATPAPPAQGSSCVGGGTACAAGLFCVDGVCCNSTCSSPCQSCTQAGKVGTCSPTCTTAPGCQSALECGSSALPCVGVVRGWIGNACHAYTGTDSGVCAANVASCLGASFDSALCTTFHASQPLAACGSPQCKKADVCVPGSPATTVDSVAALCFTTADSTDVDACAGPLERCDDAGSCVAFMTPAPPTPVPPIARGQHCTAGGTRCADNLPCVDGVCCNSACSGECQACDRPGKSGVCSPTCDDAPGCASDECASAHVQCAGVVSGWVGSSCKVHNGTNTGYCAAGTTACFDARHDASLCTAFHAVETAASCGSVGCKKPNSCLPGALADTVDTIAKICFTSLDSSDADACASAADRCDDSGSCVATSIAASITMVFNGPSGIAVIVSIAVGGLLLIVCVVWIVVLLRRRRQRSTESSSAQKPPGGDVPMRTRQPEKVVVAEATESGSDYNDAESASEETVQTLSPANYLGGTSASGSYGHVSDAQRRSPSTSRQSKVYDVVADPSSMRSSKSHGSSLRPGKSVDGLWQIALETLEFGRELGSGAFGVVHKAVWHGKNVAVKQIKRSAIGRDSSDAAGDFEVEIARMASLPFHENIVQLFGVTTLETGDLAAVVEYCSRGSLADALYGSERRHWASGERLRVAFDAACGVAHLHRNELVHRDIAARNVLLAGRRDLIAKVADFGMARDLTDAVYEHHTLNPFGPLKWMAPEQMVRRAYSKSSDVFAFGVMLFEIFKQEPPWSGVSNILVATKVMAGERMDVTSRRLPKPVAALMGECWLEKASRRPSIDEVQRRLRAEMSDRSNDSSS